ncbi:MAG: FAD-dependent oxidoreductase [Bacteroidaceae bacterium]|nr:FAD-dependent oxidoreductase [Bacteroidaceae bacterium]
MKYIIVGGVAGGATAAARIRRISEQAEILLVEKGSHISYASCGLPYYIGGVIEERSNLFLQTPEKFSHDLHIDVRVESEVVAIDVAAKEVRIRKRSGDTYKESYDKLLLSPGATPVVPPLEGIHSDGIFTLRNVADTDQIMNYLSHHTVKTAAIIGAGFIGLEMAENLHHLGKEVSIVEMANQVMAPMDYSMAAPIHQHLLSKNVHLLLEERVEKFEKLPNGQLCVSMNSGKTLTVDLVVLSIGVRPAVQLAEQAGIKIGEAGGIWVDEHLETSTKGVYAVGDVIEYPHPVSGKSYLNYLATPANRQARIVADNMVLGNTTTYEGAIGTAIAKVFDLTVATTGLPAKRLKQLGMDYLTTVTHTNSHAGYYPGAIPLTVKLTFAPVTGLLYGAQVLGYKGVDKRIDQLALLIKMKGTVADLMALEHAYAPPFSSAKDPIAIAAYSANNILNGSMPIITWRELDKKDFSRLTLIDVRTADEFSLGSLEGAINIPHIDIREHLDEIPKDKPIVLFCAIGLRGYLAQRVLMDNGFTNVRNLSGGTKTYLTAIAPIQNSTKMETKKNTPSEQDACPVVNKIKVDACGLQCPGPILKVKESMTHLKDGDQLSILSTDPAFPRDIEAWCQSTGNALLSSTAEQGKYEVVLEKNKPMNNSSAPVLQQVPKGKSFIMFSDDLDKAIATMILANGAAATGQKTVIFFTFWGLNFLKKSKKPSVKRDFWGKMFSMMLPSSSKKLALSKMNMFGLGALMIRGLMKQKGVASLETLRDQALQQGVEFIACQMSMDLLGVKKEELIDDITVGGVATYMQYANQSNVNLFI